MTPHPLQLTLEEILALHLEQQHIFLSQPVREKNLRPLRRDWMTDPQVMASRGAIAARNLSLALHELRGVVGRGSEDFGLVGELLSRAGDPKDTLAEFGWDTEFAWPIDWISDILTQELPVAPAVILPDFTPLLDEDGKTLRGREVPVVAITQLKLLALLRRMFDGICDMRFAILVDDMPEDQPDWRIDPHRASKISHFLLHEGVLRETDKPGADFTLHFHSEYLNHIAEMIDDLRELYPECIAEQPGRITFHPPNELLDAQPLRRFERLIIDELGIPLVREGRTTLDAFEASTLLRARAQEAVHIPIVKDGLRHTDIHTESGQMLAIGFPEGNLVSDGCAQEQPNAFMIGSALQDLNPHSWHNYAVHNRRLSPDEVALLAGQQMLDTLIHVVAQGIDVKPDEPLAITSVPLGPSPVDEAWVLNQIGIYAEQFHILPENLRAQINNPAGKVKILEALFTLSEAELATHGIHRRHDLSVAIIGPTNMPLHALLLAPYAAEIIFYDSRPDHRAIFAQSIRDGLASSNLPWHEYAKILTQRAPSIYANAITTVSTQSHVRDGTFETLADTISVDVGVGPFSIGSMERKGSKVVSLRHMKQILHTVKPGGLVNLTITNCDIARLSAAHHLIANTDLTDERLVTKMFQWAGGKVLDCRKHTSEEFDPANSHREVLDITVIKVGTVGEQRRESLRSQNARRLFASKEANN